MEYSDKNICKKDNPAAMSFRVYMTLKECWQPYPQETGAAIIFYLKRRGLPCELRYFSEKKKTYLYMICSCEKEAAMIAEILRRDTGPYGIFGKVLMKEGYRSDNKKITYPHSDRYRSKCYELIGAWLYQTMETRPPNYDRPELSTAL